jgi:hypothetical protein
MQIQPSTPISISAPQAAAITLRVGAEVAARVVELAGPDGRGLISLAGAVLRARLPAGLHAGDRLRLQVVGREGDQVVLRRVPEERPAPASVPASVVAELAESGDGAQLRAAVALAGGPIPLPGGRVLTVEPDAGGDESAGERGAEGSVRIVLHTAALGALELHLGLHGGSLDVNVIAAAGVAAAAAEAVPELRAAVHASTGLAPAVEVVERRGPAPPAPPLAPLAEVERFA